MENLHASKNSESLLEDFRRLPLIYRAMPMWVMHWSICFSDYKLLNHSIFFVRKKKFSTELTDEQALNMIRMFLKIINSIGDEPSYDGIVESSIGLREMERACQKLRMWNHHIRNTEKRKWSRAIHNAEKLINE